jgi:hypothetical protein
MNKNVNYTSDAQQYKYSEMSQKDFMINNEQLAASQSQEMPVKSIKKLEYLCFLGGNDAHCTNQISSNQTCEILDLELLRDCLGRKMS